MWPNNRRCLEEAVRLLFTRLPRETVWYIVRHELTASPSSAPSLRRRTPRWWRTASRSPCSFCGCGTTRRTFAPRPTGVAGVRSLGAASTSATQSFAPPWPIPLPRSARSSRLRALGCDARPRRLGLAPALPTLCPCPGTRHLPISEKRRGR